jgi:hypothetical protein
LAVVKRVVCFVGKVRRRKKARLSSKTDKHPDPKEPTQVKHSRATLKAAEPDDDLAYARRFSTTFLPVAPVRVQEVQYLGVGERRSTPRPESTATTV